MSLRSRFAAVTLSLLCAFAGGTAGAQDQDKTAPATPAESQPAGIPEPKRDWFDSGKLLATSGVSQVEGAGGGGLVPWAPITGYGTDNSIGGNAHYTYARLPDFDLHTAGLAIGLFDRVELSYSSLWFETGSAGARLGLGDGFSFRQHMFGAKLRVFGDAVFDQNSILPQVSVGLQYKVNDTEDGTILRSLSAKNTSGTDFYVAATKLLLDHSLLLNATVRATRANQIGILGFGGDENDSYRPQFEGSAALLLTRNIVVGAEYRMKPDNLRFAEEDDWFDVFAAYFFNKNVSATIAYVNLGDIALQGEQSGVYLSLTAGF